MRWLEEHYLSDEARRYLTEREQRRMIALGVVLDVLTAVGLSLLCYIALR